MRFPRAYDAPTPVGGRVPLPCTFAGEPQYAVAYLERVACEILGRAVIRSCGEHVRLDDAVREAIHHWVNAEREEVLVEMCVDTWGDACRVRRRFVGACNVDLEDSSEADLEFDGAVLIEKVIPDVFCDIYSYQRRLKIRPEVKAKNLTVICEGADHTYY